MKRMSMAGIFPTATSPVLNESDTLPRMGYRELPPPSPLASQVCCVWWSNGPGRRVLPDACADVVWTGSDLIVAGPATRAVRPSVVADDVKVGVRFRVGAAPLGLGLPAGELRDLSPPPRGAGGRGGGGVDPTRPGAGAPRGR